MKGREQSEREMRKTTREGFENPFGEGSSSGPKKGIDFDKGAVFRVYFKGLVNEESVKGEKVVLAGVGVAICDVADNLITNVSKSLPANGTSRIASELKALIEAFNAAIAMDLKRVDCFCDYYPLFQFVSGKWPAKQRKIAVLVSQVNLLRKKFTYCTLRLVARHDVKFAFKLAKDAFGSQSRTPVESGSGKSLNETCVICLEDTDINQFFSVDGCQHRYCFSCMRQHVEVKLLHGMVPKCPHEGCNNELLVDSCRKFLTYKFVETMQQRKLEASIPATEKFYCPHPRCSALMSKTEVLEYSKSLIDSESGPKKCIKCHGLFCFSCKVPWHSGMTCSTYKRLNPNPPAEDVMLKSLASKSLWRQCIKCNHMIELAEGCYHMTCRCGYEFCYKCGAEWKDKKATCTCPLWAENNIWLEEHERVREEEEENEDDYYNSDYSDDFLLDDWLLDQVGQAGYNTWLENLQRGWEEDEFGPCDNILLDISESEWEEQEEEEIGAEDNHEFGWEEEEEAENGAEDDICVEDHERVWEEEEEEEEENGVDDNICLEDHGRVGEEEGEDEEQAETDWEEEEENGDEAEDNVCLGDHEAGWEEEEDDDEDQAEDNICLDDAEKGWEEAQDDGGQTEDNTCFEDHETGWEEEEGYEDDDCYSSDYSDVFY